MLTDERKHLAYFFIAALMALLCPKLALAETLPSFELKAVGDSYILPLARGLNNAQVHGRIKLFTTKPTYHSYFDLGAGALQGREMENYFIMPQGYVKFKTTDSLSITVGRAIKSYSSMDEYWKLGDVQPLFRWDVIHPEQQGFTGFFVDFKANNNLEMFAFGSPMYLPSQGPSYTIAGGRLTSSNPWFAIPVDILDVGGTPYIVNYRIDTPSVSDILFQPSWGTGFTLKSDDQTWWMRANYFSKTRNELVLPFEGTLNIGSKLANIAVHPRSAQHKLTTVDFGYKGKKFAGTLSGLYESGIKYVIESPVADPFTPVYPDQSKVSLNLAYYRTDHEGLEAGVLRTFNSRVKVQSDVAGAQDLDIYSFRNQYDNAVDLRWWRLFMARSHGYLFKTKARLAYDYKAETSLVSLEVNYTPSPGFSIYALSDFFGGEKGRVQAYNNILVNYLNNDRAQAGVRYVF